MKVFLDPLTTSRGIMRVHDALVKYAPSNIEIVQNAADADLNIIHIFGRYDRVQRQVDYAKSHHKAYAMVQYAIRSTQHPKTTDWLPMWKGAELVWSYYNLAELLVQDLGNTPDQLPFNFYHSPLGADPKVFEDYHKDRKYVIVASGQHALAEGVRECAIAAQQLDMQMIHLGHDLRRENTKNVTGITDQELAEIYSQCQFVSGLRRIEGFELPAAEGILCGARPIMFDEPHYRKWFDGLAEFIEETDRPGVIKQLTELFKKGARPISSGEKVFAMQQFDWSIIIGTFWQRILTA